MNVIALHLSTVTDLGSGRMTRAQDCSQNEARVMEGWTSGVVASPQRPVVKQTLTLSDRLDGAVSRRL